MADLDQKERDALKDRDFALPGRRALPIQDVQHARLAWDMVDRTASLSDGEKAQAREGIKAKLKALAEPMGDDAKHRDDKARAAQPTGQRSADPVPGEGAGTRAKLRR